MTLQTSAVVEAGVTPPNGPSIYAEFLPKLGRISVVVHLPTTATCKTKALVASGGKNLIVYHDGTTTEMPLPVKAALSGEQLPGGFHTGLDRMSWRLLPHRDILAAAGSGRPGFESGAVPWSALDLKPNVDVLCRECDAVIVPRDQLREWKDLPSENWAEMMEFWHCHKPVTNGGGGKEGGQKALEDQQVSRGYGANSAIVAQKGVGFVDLTKFLFDSEDRINLVVSILHSSLTLATHPTTHFLPGIKKVIRLGVPRTTISVYVYRYKCPRVDLPNTPCLEQAAKGLLNPHPGAAAQLSRSRVWEGSVFRKPIRSRG